MSDWQDLKNNPRLKEIYNKRIEILRLTREFFWRAGFLETDTPVAVYPPSQEPYLSPVPVKFFTPDNVEHKFYLHTSPEFAMKKLLAAGYEKIFQLTKCFRNYESFGGQHNPEFMMIEWYRAPGALKEIMDDTEKLFKYIGKKLGIENLSARGNSVPLAGKWERKTMKQVWKKFVGINLDEYLTSETMRELCRKLGYDTDGRYEDLFYKIFLNKIEPFLGVKKPIFIYDYPAAMCSLSRPAEDSRYALRFELYIGGLELANAFGELTDAVKQKNNLEEDRKKRQELDREIYPVDRELIAALVSGIPQAGGIALGVDRMIMLFTGAKDINEVIFQSAADMIDKKF
ncbi:MAG: EF-P lysine aminoacylase EpmA [Patescibacteria group bacterium]